MDLSQDILKGLGLLGDPKQIVDAAFKEITQLAFKGCLNKIAEEEIWENQVLAKIDKIAVKQSYSALVAFILEASKTNSDPLSLKSILEEEKVDAKRIEFITAQYAQQKSAVRAILASTTFSFPHIVGADWRLDYFMKSHTMEKVNTPLFFVSFQTHQPHPVQEKDQLGQVQFTASLEQMQDMLVKLKDATKQVERSANV